MYSFLPSGRTVSRTFRLDQNWARILEEEAERRDISISALLNQLVHKFIYTDRYYEGGLAVTLPNKTFTALIERMREEDAAEVGNNTGMTIPEDRFLMRGMTPDYESLIWFFEEILDKYNGIFKCVHHENRDSSFLHLRHDLGENWSHFLSNYMTSTFKSLLGIDVRTELREDSVTVYIDKKPATRRRR